MRSLQTQNSDTTVAFLQCMKKAADATHTMAIAAIKVQDAKNAILSNSKEIMWHTLQQYLPQYTEFINSLSFCTNLTVIIVDDEFCKTLTVSDLKQQLNNIICFVYLKEALNSSAKETVKQSLKSQLRKANILSDTQMKLLLSLL